MEMVSDGSLIAKVGSGSLIEFEVVRVVYLKKLEIADPSEEPIKLRLEVLRSLTEGTYHVKLFRLETYSLRASFGTEEVWGKEILVTDGFTEWSAVVGDSEDAVIKAVLELLPF